MNISDWPDYKLMQLPDWVYGEKILYSVDGEAEATDYDYTIINAGLPDRCVIWDVMLRSAQAVLTVFNARVVLADQALTTAAQVDQAELVFPYVTEATGLTGWLSAIGGISNPFGPMKKLIRPQGRRLVIEFYNGSSATRDMGIDFIISGIPTDVPKWMDWEIDFLPK
jgi:hypothetical protein